MKRIAILEYTFMFDENSPWRNVDQFERDLGLAFAQKGVTLEPVDVYGDKDKRVVYIQKEVLPTIQPSPKPMAFKKATPVGGK